jgi:hypothetical protein
MALMGLSFLSFGFSGKIQNKNLFIVVQMVNRFVQGFSSSMI